MDEEALIRTNIVSLLSDHRVKAKTDEIGGDWRLHEINSHHGMHRNVEFGLILANGANRYLIVFGKINRATAKFSNIEVRDSN